MNREELTIGHEHKVIVNIIPAGSVVGIKSLARSVVGNDHIVADVVHCSSVRWVAVLYIRDESISVPAVNWTLLSRSHQSHELINSNHSKDHITSLKD